MSPSDKEIYKEWYTDTHTHTHAEREREKETEGGVLMHNSPVLQLSCLPKETPWVDYQFMSKAGLHAVSHLRKNIMYSLHFLICNFTCKIFKILSQLVCMNSSWGQSHTVLWYDEKLTP